MNYEGLHMNADTVASDGVMYFEKTHFRWMPRDASRAAAVSRPYAEIDRIQTMGKIKKTVWIYMTDGTEYAFHLYRSLTFIELLDSGKRANLSPARPSLDSPSEMSAEDIDKLLKLAKLHEEGVLNDEEYRYQTQAIKAKYR